MEETAWQPGILWRVRLLDGPLVENAGGELLCRFRSHKVGALLAYLALHLGRPCPREELYFALWPEENDIKVAANRLRVTLTSLRRQLEPSGVTFGTVLDASVSGRVALRAETVWCDAIAVERAAKAGRFEEAAELGRGTLLPGFYEDWALTARRHIETLCEHSLRVAAPGMGRSSPEPQQQNDLATPNTNVQAAPEHLIPNTSHQPPATRPSLPLYLTRFFGREAEQRQLLDLLAVHRLVTLIGPGGMGKTRLTVETACHTPRPPLFVSLVELTDGRTIAEAILRALLISTRPETDPEQYLIEVLQSRDATLLILDNAEHLLESVAELSLRLLHAIPSLRLLITSRQRLNVPGEAALALPSLPLPDTPDLERLLEFPAVALFVDRARMSRPDFIPAPRHADGLREICRRVEGMPLALELAGARIALQTPAQIAHSLASGLLDLKSRQRGLSARHRSLRAVIQGSFDLLPSELQRFFIHLAVFQGGWTGEAVQSITGCAETDEFLEELIQRSLVVTREDEQTGRMRYGFLETVRQFAAEQLSVPEREQSTQRHAAYFLGLAALTWEDDARALRPLDSELKNLLLALENGWQAPSDTFWWGTVGALMYMFVRGQHRVALIWAERALVCICGLTDCRLRVRLRNAVCIILADMGRLDDVRRVSQEAWEDAEANGDEAGAISAHAYFGYAANEAGKFDQALDLQRAALQRARRLDNPHTLRLCLSLTARALLGFGVAHREDGETFQAALRECEVMARECLTKSPPHSLLIPMMQLALSVAFRHLRRDDEAYTFLKLAQQTALAQGAQALLMYCFFHECITAWEQGHWGYATLLLGAFLNLQERMDYSLATATAYVENLRRELAEHLGHAVYEALVQQGRQMFPAELAACSLFEPSSLPIIERN